MFGHKKVALHLIEFLFNVYRIQAVSDVFLPKVNKNVDAQRNVYLSCQNRCGVLPLKVKLYQLLCFCHETCFPYRNCCEDFATKCPLVAKKGLEKFGHMLNLEVKCLTMADALAIASCPQEEIFTERLINKKSISDIINNIPTMDSLTGLVYANVDIFNCNVPNGSERKSEFTAGLIYNQLFSDKMFAKIEHYTFHSPYYYHTNSVIPCLYSTIGYCDRDILLRFLCDSIVSWLSIRYYYCVNSFCSLCRLNVTHICVKGHFDTRDQLVPVSKGLELVPVIQENLAWTKAQCNVSSLGWLTCRFVNCSTYLGFYLHQDGTCRRFAFFFIAFPGDGWRLDESENQDILDYITYYVLFVLNIDILNLDSMRSLYNHTLDRNFSVCTFVLDFNSSVSEDFLYLHYSHELSILASDVRSMVARKLNRNDPNIPNLSLVCNEWIETYQNGNIRPYKKYIERSSYAAVRWCGYSDSKLLSAVGTTMDVTYSNVQIGEIIFCLCRTFSYNRWAVQDCQHKPFCEFQCYDELTFGLSGRHQSGQSSVHSWALKQLLFVVLSDVLLFQCCSNHGSPARSGP
ncbi:hypothetical protein BgiBS90_023081 [Biomphalaria glabrata]|nr:hypothetical protein BgiBS90_023081 [Biomphalaria glabrata]